MLSLSQAYATADPASAPLFQTVAIAVGTLRKWSHYSALLVAGSWIFLLCGFLYRSKLVPRALAACGLLGALGQIGGVSRRGLWGYPPATLLAVPLAPAYTTNTNKQIVKGYSARARYSPVRRPA